MDASIIIGLSPAIGRKSSPLAAVCSSATALPEAKQSRSGQKTRMDDAHTEVSLATVSGHSPARIPIRPPASGGAL
jgi:hypothetical protein